MIQVKIENTDAELFTLVAENKGRESIVLLHGGPGVPEDMDPLLEYFSGNFQVIYFHQRGTGNSPCSSGKFSMERYISDIDKIASHFNLKKFHLFGHSWGGLYAGIYAERRKEKILSLFLCSPASGTGKQWIEMGLEVRKYNKKKSSFYEWMGILKNSFLGTIGLRKPHQKFFKQFGINSNKSHKVEGFSPLQIDLVRARAVNRTNKNIIKYGELRQITDPGYEITVTYGDDDIYGDSPKYVRGRYPTGKFITIPDCGHMQWLHNAKIFYEALAKHYNLPY